MNRRLPTTGSAEWFQKYIEEFIAQVMTQVPAEKRDRVLEQARAVQAGLGAISHLKGLGQIEEVPVPRKLDQDETAHLAFDENWQPLAAMKFADMFGRYGLDAVATVAEVACHSQALASAFGAHKVFYRGEEHYGYPLKSRAERHLEDGEGGAIGLTKREIRELRRFQREVKRCKNRTLRREIRGRSFFLPRRNSPIWLPLMQHYDEKFGTRLLDITTSVYAGLYFACISWDGTIDASKDGILYAFYLGEGSGMTVRGFYYDRAPENFDSDYDNLAPKRLQESFLDWKASEYFRVYKSASANPREAAQDGWFLVRGSLKEAANYGQGFKFRVPGDAKEEIASQLWMAGYTPERIVRGDKGRQAHKALKASLGMKY